LKANYPVEFMAGLLSNEIDNTDKISVFVGECKRMGITILPPDVNRSGLKFTPEKTDDGMAIRYGLAAIKNVGQGAMEAAIREREESGEFKSLEDFCRRLDSRVANRKMLESLVKCGAFDFLGHERADLFACIDESLAAASESHKDRASGQVSLFDDIPAPVAKTGSRAVTPWTQHESMTYEKELLGFYVTGHPLDAYAGVIAAGNYQTIISLAELDDRASFRVAGSITQVDKKFTKKEGKPFAVVFVEDLTSTLEVVVWSEVYTKVSDSLVPGRVIAIQGTLDKRDDTVRATAQKAKVLTPDNPGAARTNGAIVEANGADYNEANGDDEGALVLRFSPAATPQDLREVREILRSTPGQTAVRLMFERPDGELLCLAVGSELSIKRTPDLKQKLARWLPA
jgi:DNA polymerase-3 subunit alpha